VDQAIEAKALNADLNAGGRVKVEAPGLSGSINLVGAVVDDLSLNRHKQTVDKDSAPVRLFSPPVRLLNTLLKLGGSGRGDAQWQHRLDRARWRQADAADAGDA
jgi:YidC/Oxa1 family membrane protein insertase